MLLRVCLDKTCVGVIWLIPLYVCLFVCLFICLFVFLENVLISRDAFSEIYTQDTVNILYVYCIYLIKESGLRCAWAVTVHDCLIDR